MTIKELKTIINSYNGMDSAQVYVEVSIGDNVYIQKPVENLRVEQFTQTYCIIAGSEGGESV